jgi:hypothetical protein
MDLRGCASTERPTITDEPAESHLTELSEHLRTLVAETAWPDTDQGAVVQLFAQDLEEFCAAAIAELVEGRWSVAMGLHRPIQERTEHMVAAAADEEFARKFSDDLSDAAGANTHELAKAKPRGGDARGVLNRMETGKASDQSASPLTAMIALQAIGCRTLHPGLTMPALSMAIRDGDPNNNAADLLSMTGGRLALALQSLVVAVMLLDAHDSDAWRHASATANQWFLDFEGMTLDDLTGGDPSIVRYI